MSATISEPGEKLVKQFQKESCETEPHPGERRKHARRKYGCWQLVAEFDGENLPLQREFELFEFRDISPSGIAFEAKELPLSNDLVLALGTMPFEFFHARIVRVVCSPKSSELLIGCKLLKRLCESA
jgi:hypothetical protein